MRVRDPGEHSAFQSGWKCRATVARYELESLVHSALQGLEGFGFEGFGFSFFLGVFHFLKKESILFMKQPNYALKHTCQLRSVASTLCMCTTISPRHWQPWTAVSPLLGLISMARPLDNTGRENLHIKDLLLPKRVQSTPLSNSWLGTAKAKQLSHGMHMKMGSEKLTCVPPKILKQPNVTLNRILATFVMEQKWHVRTTRWAC